MSICGKGILFGNLDGANESETDVALVSGQGYRNLHFYGSFCPPNNGVYRLIFEGSFDPMYEPLFSFYRFNQVSTQNRTTPYHALDSNTCYPYFVNQAILYNESNWGALYFQKINEEKILMSSNFSLKCERLVCKRGSNHPDCYKKLTAHRCLGQIYLSLGLVFLLNDK